MAPVPVPWPEQKKGSWLDTYARRILSGEMTEDQLQALSLKTELPWLEMVRQANEYYQDRGIEPSASIGHRMAEETPPPKETAAIMPI